MGFIPPLFMDNPSLKPPFYSVFSQEFDPFDCICYSYFVLNVDCIQPFRFSKSTNYGSFSVRRDIVLLRGKTLFVSCNEEKKHQGFAKVFLHAMEDGQ